MRRRLALLLASASLIIGCGGGATPTPVPTAEGTPTPAPTDIYAETPAPSEVVEPTPTPEATATPVAGSKYTVKKGDTLWAIAKKYGITVEALQAANPKVVPTKMRIGTVLVIPPKP